MNSKSITKTISIPDDVKFILSVLQTYNIEAYIVGGCVRDSLLGRTPNDWDICTAATPEEVKKIFSKFHVIETGIQHGTVTIMYNGEPYEITTFRCDGDYSDGRHPDQVEFVRDLEQDLDRRDFTINAMVYDGKGKVYDYHYGIIDLDQKRINTVGNPDERFKEDALRMLRAFRFRAQLGFKIESTVMQAIVNNKDSINLVSKERIMSEINKILLSDNPDVIGAISLCGLFDDIIPELKECFRVPQNNPYHIYYVGDHIMHSMQEIEPTLHLRLTMLFHDIAKPAFRTTDEQGIDHFHGHAEGSAKVALEILTNLRYNTDTVNRVVQLIQYHDAEIVPTRAAIKRWLNKLGEEVFRDLLKVRQADISAQNEEHMPERYNKLSKAHNVLEEVLASQECFDRKSLAVNGNDLIAIGFKPGKEIGTVLEELMQHVLDNPEENTNFNLLVIANSKLKR